MSYTELENLTQEQRQNLIRSFNKDNDFYIKAKKPWNFLKTTTYVHRQTRKEIQITPQKIRFKNDVSLTKDVINLAVDNGWKKINIKSKDPVISQTLWLEANLRNIETKGYTPTKDDLRQLDNERQKERENKEALSIKAAPKNELFPEANSNNLEKQPLEKGSQAITTEEKEKYILKAVTSISKKLGFTQEQSDFLTKEIRANVQSQENNGRKMTTQSAEKGLESSQKRADEVKATIAKVQDPKSKAAQQIKHKENPQDKIKEKTL